MYMSEVLFYKRKNKNVNGSTFMRAVGWRGSSRYRATFMPVMLLQLCTVQESALCNLIYLFFFGRF